MTLLTISNAVADEIQITRPGSVVGNNTPDSQRMLRFANKVGTWLMKKAVWQDLRKEKTFTALGQAVQTSILPSDFDRFVPETFWDRTNRSMLVGPIPAVRWQSAVAGAYSGYPRYFIHRGDDVSVQPAFDGGESLAFEYVSNQWAASSGATAQTSFQADTDTTVFDEDLMVLGIVFEWLSSEGQPAATAFSAYMDRMDTLLGNDQPRAGILAAGDIFSGGRHFTGEPQSGGTGSLI